MPKSTYDFWCILIYLWIDSNIVFINGLGYLEHDTSWYEYIPMFVDIG